ncbi:uncharacterized protein LOC100370387 [Saccoglossus kowalevskii]|uniref:Uncharacterized protein LOC100370387 n=1 Tax=Saccoglossus kowalevskii TaxID=10224 RepID=A0ABM0GZZ0_SACKO|nr:PREDICTED: uncharacterized protein LOC100370387 [Saccoglossus kowalevskii]
MSSAKQLAIEAGVDRLHCFVKRGGDKMVSFTSCAKYDDTWTLHVTDGIDVWRLEMDKKEVDSHKELADIKTYDVFFAKIKSAFESSDLDVATQGHGVTLTVGKGGSTLNFDLYEATASKRKTDLQNILLHLAATATSLKKDLKSTAEELDRVKKEKGSGLSMVSTFYDPDAGRKSGTKDS